MKVLSFNCWGLPWTGDYKVRMEAIRVALLQSDYDLVILQEIFMGNVIDNFKESLSVTFPYIHYFHSGFIGSGVMFLSKYRIRDAIAVPYTQSGMVYHTGGDWFSRKSICYAKIEYPNKIIHTFGTHTHAKYIANDYKAVRTLQLYNLARLVQLFTKPNDAIIVAGDLNTEFHEIGVKQLIDRCHLEDPFYRFYDDSSPIYTCNDRMNKYSCKRDMPYRIDHIFHSKHFEAVSYKTVLKQVPSTDTFYSDHSGVEVELKYTDIGDSGVSSSNGSLRCQVENLHTMKQIFKRGFNESVYSLKQNIFIGLLVFWLYQLSARIWETLIPGSTIFHSINPIFYTALILMCVFCNLVSYISIRSQQRTFFEAIEEISNDTCDFEEI